MATDPDPAESQFRFPALDPQADWVTGFNQYRGELNAAMNVTITLATREQFEATMPVAGNRQPAGLLHGGASAVLAETLGSMHATVLAPEGTMPVGIELSCSHHRAARQGIVTGVCVPVHAGRTLATFQIVLTDVDGRRTCTARLTCAFISSPG